MIGVGAEAYKSAIGSHEIAATEGTEVDPRVGAKMNWSISSDPGRCALPTNPTPEKRGCGSNNDHPTHPAQHTVVSSCAPFSGRSRAESTLGAKFIPGEAALLGQEAKPPSLTLEYRCWRRRHQQEISKGPTDRPVTRPEAISKPAHGDSCAPSSSLLTPFQTRLQPFLPHCDIVPTKQLEVLAVQETNLVKYRVVRVILGPCA